VGLPRHKLLKRVESLLRAWKMARPGERLVE
jgi:hypothetical protein